MGEWLDAQTPAVSSEEEHKFVRAFDEADWSFVDLPDMDDHVHVAKAKCFEGKKECMGMQTPVLAHTQVRVVSL